MRNPIAVSDARPVLLAETATAERVALATCSTCSTVTAPDGACLEIGACADADAAAARRGASGATAKAAAAPSAWNARGNVD